MKRREFISILGGAAATWPLAARAQQQVMPVIGFLGAASPILWATRLRAFHDGLGEMGYFEGRNTAIEYRWAAGDLTRFPAMAADLVSLPVNVIAIAGGTASVLAAKSATGTIPIVFQVGTDPIEIGLVASLSRPGGNLTGVTSLAAELGPKRLELLHELVPKAKLIALLVNPTNPGIAESLTRDVQAAALMRGLELHVLSASTEREIDAAFASLRQSGAEALLVAPDPFFNSRSDQLAKLTLGHMTPTIFQLREFAAAGGLVSYGSSLMEQFRQIGVYTGRILNGEKPADLPVQQSTKFELIINLKTAKALGINIPLSLLGRADEVIE
jgi:putative ABC transport system substrate-binding protein